MTATAKKSTKAAKPKAEFNKSSAYWGIKKFDEVLFEGTFEATWSELGKRYPNATMADLDTQGIKIGRIK